MPTPKRGARLAGGPSQQKALLRNQATELFRHGRITTTHAKAKFLRPYAEKLITKAKRGDLHNRRLVVAELRDKDVVAHLFDEVAPRFTDRPGGYTRIIKLGPRKGDNAPMALIELVDRGSGSAEVEIAEAKESRRRGLFSRRRRQEAVPATEDFFEDESFEEDLEDASPEVAEEPVEEPVAEDTADEPVADEADEADDAEADDEA